MSDDDIKNDATFNMRVPRAERIGLDWLADERTREVREAAKLASLKISPAEALRELLRNELDRRGWPGPAKPASGKRRAG